MRQLTVRSALDTLPTEYLGSAWRETGVGVRRGGLKALLCQWAGELVLVAGLAACAAISVDSAPEEKAKFVAERAEARWQLLIKGDVAGAYQYLSAGSKAATSLDVYTAKIKPGMWREAKVEKVDCEKEICKALLQITYDAKRMKGIQTPLVETWVIESGSAGYVFH